MKIFRHFSLICIICTATVTAQPVFNLRILDAGAVAGTQDLLIQINAEKSFGCGGANIVLTFDSQLYSTPSLVKAFHMDGGSYAAMNVTQPAAGLASINIEYTGDPGEGCKIPVHPAWMDLAIIRLQQTNGSAAGIIGIQNTDVTLSPTVQFSDDFQTIARQGAFNSLRLGSQSTNLVQLSGDILADGVRLEWRLDHSLTIASITAERYIAETKQWTSVSTTMVQDERQGIIIDSEAPSTAELTYRLRLAATSGETSYSVVLRLMRDRPAVFEVYQNYPNPSTTTTVVPIFTPFATKVEIHVLDLQGKEMLLPWKQDVQAGYNSILIDAGKLSSGAYQYRISDGSTVRSRWFSVTK